MIRYKSLIKKISLFLGVLLLVVSVFNTFSNSVLFQSPKVEAAGCQNGCGLSKGVPWFCKDLLPAGFSLVSIPEPPNISYYCAYLTPPCPPNTYLSGQYGEYNGTVARCVSGPSPCPDQQTVNGVCMPVCDPPKVADTNPQSPTFQQCVGVNAVNDLSNGPDGNNPLPAVAQPDGTNVKPKTIYVMKNNGQANNAYRTNLKLDVLQNDGPNPSSLSADSISNIVYPAGNKGQVDPVVSDGGKFITITAPWGFSNAISNQPKTMSFNYKAKSATQTSSNATVTLTLKCFDDTKPNDPATDLPFDVNTLASEYNNDPNNINENFGLGSNYKFPGTPGQEYKFQVTSANGEIVKYTVPANLAGSTKAMAGQKRLLSDGTPVDYLCPVLGNTTNPNGSYRSPATISNLSPSLQRQEAVKRVLDLINGDFNYDKKMALRIAEQARRAPGTVGDCYRQILFAMNRAGFFKQPLGQDKFASFEGGIDVSVGPRNLSRWLAKSTQGRDQIGLVIIGYRNNPEGISGSTLASGQTIPQVTSSTVLPIGTIAMAQDGDYTSAFCGGSKCGHIAVVVGYSANGSPVWCSDHCGNDQMPPNAKAFYFLPKKLN